MSQREDNVTVEMVSESKILKTSTTTPSVIQPTFTVIEDSPRLKRPEEYTKEDLRISAEHISGLLVSLNKSGFGPYKNETDLYDHFKKHPLREALYAVLCEKKEEICMYYPALPSLSSSAGIVEERVQSMQKKEQPGKLDTMLYECLIGADMGPPSPEPGQSAPVSEDKYKDRLSTIKTEHKRLRKEIDDIKKKAEEDLDEVITRQMEYRPISKQDHDRLLEVLHTRCDSLEDHVKKKTLSDIMLINNKCLDARRRRKNFGKETTEVLMKFFEEHIDHPYPDEHDKQRLAEKCGMTVQQVANWFGNRRIRMKKQVARPLQPPPKRRHVMMAPLSVHHHHQHQHSTRRNPLPPVGVVVRASSINHSHDMNPVPSTSRQVISTLRAPPSLLSTTSAEDPEQISALVRSSIAFTQ